MFFTRFLARVLQSPKLIGLAIAFLFLLGAMTYRGLRVDLFPPLNFPTLNLITEAPSFSSLEMERQVTLPIESAVGGVLGVHRVRSTSATGISMVSAEFEWGTDMTLSRQRLIEALGGIRGQLPAGTEPVIESLSATLSQIEGFSLQGGTDLVRLRDMALYELKPRLQRIPGVYKILVMGGRILEYSVSPNPYLMVKYDVSLTDLKEALASNNILSSPGVVNHGAQELVLHSNGQFADEKEIAQVVVAVKNGTPVRIHDVAQVRKSFQYERGDTSEGGFPSVLIQILKQPDFDTGTVASAIRTEIGAFEQGLPQGFTVHNFYDQAQLVADSINSVGESVWIGGLLVVIILALFLHSVRSTLIAALSIPISVISALVLMRAFGIGLNIMSLGGLAIGTGIIVDDTIVVLENIFRWLSSPELRRNHGDAETVTMATHEVLRPVIVSTLANIGIFLPMVLVEGFAGRLFAPVSFTVTFALTASLIVALTVIPLLAFRWLPKSLPIQSEAVAKVGFLRRTYAPLLRIAILHPKKILLAAIFPLLAGIVSYRHLNVEFLPALDEGAIQLQTIMPSGTSLPEAARLNRKLETWAKQAPGVVTVVRRTGHAQGAEDTDNVNHSDITLKLAPKNARTGTIESLIDALKAKTGPLPSIVVNYLMPLADKINDAMGGVPADLGIDLFGPNLDELHTRSDQLLQKMQKIPGITDLRPPSDLPVPSLEIQVNKSEAGRLGIPERVIHETLAAYSTGLEATRIREVQKEIAVVLHFAPPGQTLNLEELGSLPLKTSGGSTVPLEQIAQLHYAQIPSEISHEHLSRKLTLTANVKGRNTADVAADVRKAIQDLKLPAGYSWQFSGKYQTEQNALSNLGWVLTLAIFVVAAILWIEFRSFAQVGLILMTIPLAAVGAAMSLWFFHESLNVSSMIGSVMLVGIVVRNGIMLLDYMNRQLDLGHSVEKAVHEAAEMRVRPILMTASVTILGLLPLAAGWGTGAELQRPLAIAVIGGILTSTLLTLLILPAAARWVVPERSQAGESRA